MSERGRNGPKDFDIVSAEAAFAAKQNRPRSRPPPPPSRLLARPPPPLRFPPPNQTRPRERSHFSAYAPYPPYSLPYPYPNPYQHAPAYDPYAQYYEQYDYGYEGSYDVGYHGGYGNAEKDNARRGFAEKYKPDQKMDQDENQSSDEDPTKGRHSPSPDPPTIPESNQTGKKKKPIQHDDEPSQSSKRSRHGKKKEKEASKSKDDDTSSDPEKIQPPEPKRLRVEKKPKKVTPKKRNDIYSSSDEADESTQPKRMKSREQGPTKATKRMTGRRQNPPRRCATDTSHQSTLTSQEAQCSMMQSPTESLPGRSQSIESSPGQPELPKQAVRMVRSIRPLDVSWSIEMIEEMIEKKELILLMPDKGTHKSPVWDAGLRMVCFPDHTPLKDWYCCYICGKLWKHALKKGTHNLLLHVGSHFKQSVDMTLTKIVKLVHTSMEFAVQHGVVDQNSLKRMMPIKQKNERKLIWQVERTSKLLHEYDIKMKFY